jgi:hypothetical protein
MHFGRWKKLDSIILKGMIGNLLHRQGQCSQGKSIHRQLGIMINLLANKEMTNGINI